MKTVESDVTLEAHPAMAGWAIMAMHNGIAYYVEGGLRTPNGRLKYWQKNIEMIRSVIARATNNATKE